MTSQANLSRECAGFFGWLFGHKMEPIVSKMLPPVPSSELLTCEMIRQHTAIEYTICCARCGAKPEGDK